MPLSPFVFGGDDDDEDDDELRDMEAWTRSIARRAFCPFCSSLSAAPHRRPSHTIQPTQEEIDTVEEDLELHGQDELIVKALASGGEELRQYTRQIEGDLRMVERESIGDYVQESENLANLHMQIRGCDEVLGKMEASLGSFQHELGKVSSEIQSLQARSSGLNVRAENRKNVEAGLARYIDGAAVSPALIHAVTESEVSEAYMAFVLQLRRKCEFVETDSAKAVLSTASVAPVLEKLRVKATERIRIFLLTKIAALGRPKTNFQIIQQSVLLKLSNLMAFLLQHAPEVYEEVSGRYVETMGRIYLHHIKAHLRHLARCQAECVSAADTLVQSEDAVPAASPRATVTALFASAAPAGAAFSISGMSSMLGLGPSSPAPGGPGAATRSRDSALAVGARAVVLEGDGADVLLKLTADLGTKHAPEYTFKGLLAVLLSAAASEGAFAARFLGGDSGALRAVFRPAFAAVEESVQLQVAESHDAIGLLLMIGVARRLAQGLTQSGCETLSPLFDALNMILWPRFKALLDLHVTSVKSAAPASLVASSAEKYPHTITRRFAELSASLLLLRDASSAEMLDHSLTYMRGEVGSPPPPRGVTLQGLRTLPRLLSSQLTVTYSHTEDTQELFAARCFTKIVTSAPPGGRGGAQVMALLSRMAATLPDERLQLVFRINQVCRPPLSFPPWTTPIMDTAIINRILRS